MWAVRSNAFWRTRLFAWRTYGWLFPQWMNTTSGHREKKVARLSQKFTSGTYYFNDFRTVGFHVYNDPPSHSGPNPLSSTVIRQWDKLSVAMGAVRLWLHRRTVSFVWWEKIPIRHNTLSDGNVKACLSVPSSESVMSWDPYMVVFECRNLF